MAKKLASALLVAAITTCTKLAFAQVDCGPHSRLGSITALPDGNNSYHCVCDLGYVPSSTVTVYAPKGTVLHPPICVAAGGGARFGQSQPPRQSRGGYLAETPRENPPAREAAPARQQRRSPSELGATTPAQTSAPAPQPEVPVPRSGAAQPSDMFPTEKSPAAIRLDQTGFARIRDVPLPSPTWIREKVKETGKEHAFEFAWDQMPMGELVNHVRDLRQRMTELGESRTREVKEYVVHVFRLGSDVAGCLGSADARCAQAYETEGVLKKFGAAQEERRNSWLTQELGKGTEVLGGEK